ncbi:MAG: spermidine synthase, partial [Acidobacteria bacterium]|nr:spermidine synthase [Acidobacteriota bacterium]
MTSGLAERVRHPRFERLLVGALFLISGLAALVYQVAWQRLLAFHSGVGVTSVALIVGAFMAGLGLGSHVGGALSARVSRGAALRAFGLIEIGIGLFAVISCWLFYDVLLHRASGLYATVWGSAAGHVLALGIPTTLMGMSLPFLVRAMVRDGATAPGTIAVLYGINVVGAAVGALVTPWVLIRHLGIPGAVLAGAAGSLLTGLVTLGLSLHPSWRSGESAEAPASRPAKQAGAQGLGLWAALYGLSGFVAL